VSSIFALVVVPVIVLGLAGPLVAGIYLAVRLNRRAA
jgi:hypothetical protein